MSEQELIQALRALIERHAPSVSESSRIAQEIVRRDTWRLRILGALSILLCLVGIAGIIVVFFWMNRYFMMSSWEVNDRNVRMEIFHAQRELHHSLEAAMGCLAAFMLGLFCTVWLISSSRRATLSQINLSLLRLSEEIKRLGPPSGEPDREAQQPATIASYEFPLSAALEPPLLRRQLFWAATIAAALVMAVLLSISEVQANLAWLIRHVRIWLNLF